MTQPRLNIIGLTSNNINTRKFDRAIIVVVIFVGSTSQMAWHPRIQVSTWLCELCRRTKT